jgi:hypothetical protein
MGKWILGFASFAALAMFALFQGGANIDMGGEKHGADAVGAEAKAAAGVSPGASTPTGQGK